jgi:hypothetical protein
MAPRILNSWLVHPLLLLVAVALFATELLQAQPPAKPGPQLVLLDGSAVPFRSLNITAGKLSGEGVPAELAFDELARIELPTGAAESAEQPVAIVDLRSGGRVQAKSVGISDEKCKIDWNHGQPLSLAVDLVRAIRLDPFGADPEFEKALAAPSAERDQILVKDDAGKLSALAGLIDALDAEQLKLQVAGQERSIARSKVFGIIVAQSAATDSPPHCLVTFRDGSLLGGESLSLADGDAELEFAAGGKADFKWSAVSRVTIRSSRVAYLSDLKPLTEEQQPLVTLPMPAQRDKSVSGGVLTLGSRTYEKGLGVHARSSLAFAADKKWDTLAATIGLDEGAGRKGDCVFTVLADGQPLFSRRMKGTDPAEEIQLSITGREQVTLLVEPGEALDLADHANWCDARFIKRAK